MKSKPKFPYSKTIQYGGKLVSLTDPLVMGIINLTPDSFYSASRKTSISAVLEQVTKHLSEGASILDFGAISSRPGSKPVDYAEEKKRLLSVIKEVKKVYPDILISVDTFRAEIVKEIFESCGPFICNDITAGKLDPELMQTVGNLKLPYILMHMKATPENMQIKPDYKNITKEILFFFAEKIRIAKDHGIIDTLVDPGFGFGKTIDHNYLLLNNMDLFTLTGCPIVAGISRKSMIYNLLDTNAEEALFGTIAAQTVALLKGVSILRVHDVKAANDAIRIVKKLKEFN